MTRVAVVGATGYAGAELVRILAGHPRVELTTLTSRQHAGERFDAVYPSMRGTVDLVCETFDAEGLIEKADFVFTALPHKLPMEIVPGLLERGIAVIDLSADFRFSDAGVYEAHYQPHKAPELLTRAVYGLAEVYTAQIGTATLVGNPGCYPTSVLLPLVPLLSANLLKTDTIIADSKSGVSGAGRSPTLTTHFCEVSESFKAYKVAEHRHTPEMDAVLSEAAAGKVCITFVPHLVPMSRGMLTTIYAELREGAEPEEIGIRLAEFYRKRPFIRLHAMGTLPDTRNVRGTNYCDIGFRYDPRSRRIILLSAIDNLVKGAAGQAVQNMNIMLGFNEVEGLLQAPFPL